MLCCEIMKIAGLINTDEWNYFLRGATGFKKEHPRKPDVGWLSQAMWKEACNMEFMLNSFVGFSRDITATPCWVQLGHLKVSIDYNFI